MTTPDRTLVLITTAQLLVRWFLLTLVSIRLILLLAAGLGWRSTFLILAIGPALGTLAMVSQARVDRLDAGIAR